MSALNLAEIRECVAHGDRGAALRALRAAIDDRRIVARDGIELMLAVRQGSAENIAEAIGAWEKGLPGAYRYIPKMAHAPA